MDSNVYYLEDFQVGQKFTSPKKQITEQEIIEFATQYDPQPFHLDPVIAKSTFFKNLVASGWQTASITMRLLVNSNLRPDGGIVGAGIDLLRWPNPVIPDDELTLDIEIMEIIPSTSKPNQGIVKTKVLTKNQNNLTVMSYVATMVVKRRPSSPN